MTNKSITTASRENRAATDPAMLEAVYRRRAAQLARRQGELSARKTFPALVFGLGTESYAIELAELAEVLPYRGSTQVPGSLPVLVGVINLRGVIRAVADLRKVLGIAEGGEATAGYVLLLRRREGTIGFKVDSLEGVRHLDPAEMRNAAFGGAPMSDLRFIKALTADTVALLDIGGALADLVP